MSSIWHEVLYRPLFNVLILIYHYLPDIGVAIIILTIIIRLILYPSQSKALRAAKKMRDLQPEINKIQEKYKHDKQKQSKAMMEFWQTHRVNPLSSCLGQIIQIPILIALYQVFSTGLDISRLTELYSFIPKPTTIDPTLFGLINLAEPNRYILPVIAGIAQFFQMKIMMPPALPSPASAKKSNLPNTQEMISKQMIYFMPVMIVFFAASLPAALPLYWIVISIIAIIQQVLINRETTQKKVTVRIKK